MDLPSDLIDLLAEFADTEVEYLLVGGQALALHGLPRFTKDADLWLRDAAENVRRAQTALTNFGAPATVVEALPSAAPLDVVWMGSPPSRIDLMKGVPGGDFERAWQSRETRRLHDTVVQLVSREELISLKIASGRPQDLVDASNLQRLG
jgi:hypothetical protein